MQTEKPKETLLPIPRLYWDTLQISFHAEVKRLAKDIARCLHRPEHTLLKAIQHDTLGAYIFEESNSELVDIQSMRCNHFVPNLENPSVLSKCNQPILLGGGHSCPAHLQTVKKEVPSLQKLRIVKSSFGETFWVDEHNILRKKGDLKPCGKYIPETKLCILFELE